MRFGVVCAMLDGTQWNAVDNHRLVLLLGSGTHWHYYGENRHLLLGGVWLWQQVPLECLGAGHVGNASGTPLGLVMNNSQMTLSLDTCIGGQR